MLQFVAVLVLWGTVAYLAWFAVMVWCRPQSMKQYLLAFASSQRLHLLELLIRLCIGASFWLISGPLQASVLKSLLEGFALILLLTSTVLLLLPWHWHQRFAASTVPKALPFLPWLGVSAAIMALALLLLLSAVMPSMQLFNLFDQ